MNIHDVNGSYTELQFGHTYDELADLVATLETLITRRPDLPLLAQWRDQFAKRLAKMTPPTNPTQPRLL